MNHSSCLNWCYRLQSLVVLLVAGVALNEQAVDAAWTIPTRLSSLEHLDSGRVLDGTQTFASPRFHCNRPRHRPGCQTTKPAPEFPTVPTQISYRRHLNVRRATNDAGDAVAETLPGISGSSNKSTLDVVLFGIGDLRTDDHGGLQQALQLQHQSGGNFFIVPVVVWTKSILSKMPGAIAHTVDTAHMIASALQDLQASLYALDPTWHLQVFFVEDDEMSLREILLSILPQRLSLAPELLARIRVHVCDLGTVDQALNYGPLAYLSLSSPLSSQESRPPALPLLEIVPWRDVLREEPWTQLAELPDTYPVYTARFAAMPPIMPVNATELVAATTVMTETSQQPMLPVLSLPSAEDFLQRIVQAAGLDPARCTAEQNTGLFATHWGGLKPNSVGCQAVLSKIQAYVSECQQDDLKWAQHAAYVGRACRNNGRSLEHAAMIWQLRGDGTSPVGQVDRNWLPGESIVRYLAAPLLLGTVSMRRLWHMAAESSSWLSTLIHGPLSLHQLVEGREWHRLLASRNIQIDPAYSSTTTHAERVVYKYWRYQGFLCRYVQTNPANTTKMTDAVNPIKSGNKGNGNNEKQGMLLVHGFGASGAQWNKMMIELLDQVTNPNGINQGAESSSPAPLSRLCDEGLAPDLIGFGQAEKPAISYTGYMWDSMLMDFVKEIAITESGWTSFVTGGNSIGGFASMQFAACDTASIKQQADAVVTSSGAPGTGRCTGLVLMNSAGPCLSREEVEAIVASPRTGLQRNSVAQVTALEGLPNCKPPYRPFARAFGNGLLWYLRPNIRSICKNLYPTNPSAVDSVLCDSILRDSLDPGAIFVMMAGAKLPPPRTANELLQADFGAAPASRSSSVSNNYGRHSVGSGNGQVVESAFDGPVLISQGVLDPLNNSTDRMLRFGALRANIQTDAIPAGHCPHDELPEQVAGSVARWLVSTGFMRESRLKGRLSSMNLATSASAQGTIAQGGVHL